MTPQQKASFVQALHQLLCQSQVVLLVHQNGLTVIQTQALRYALMEAGGAYKVVKNRLGKLSVQNTEFAPLAESLSGPTAFIIGTDPVALARVINAFAAEHPAVTIRGGFFAGRLLSLADIQALAKLPSYQQLQAKLIGALKAPAAKLAALTAEPGRRIARLMASKN